jgi:hypothetical protein
MHVLVHTLRYDVSLVCLIHVLVHTPRCDVSLV